MSEPLGVVATAEAFARGEISAESATEAALSRLQSIVHLNAIGTLTPDAALEQARAQDKARAKGHSLGPLAGVPMAHKDLFFRRGRTSHCGSLIAAGTVADTTATVLTRLDAAGAIDLGTLHMAEFALSPTGYNKHYGHGRNPWNPDYICGGSSSGSGIAVAARAVTASLGTDTGGSLRHPAAACGLTGLKPTHGAVSVAGVMALSATLDTIGPLATRAVDVARIMDVIAGEDQADPTTAWTPELDHEASLSQGIGGLTLARPRGYYDGDLDSEIAAALDDVAATISGLGATIVETTSPDMASANSFAHLVMAVEAATLHRHWLTNRPQDYADQVRARIEPGLCYPATHYVEALMRRGAIAKNWIDMAIGSADAALLPAFPVPVQSIASTTEGDAKEVASTIATLTRNTRAINYLGLPSIAFPIGFDRNGLPIACQIVGRPWSEPLLLRFAEAFQKTTDFHLSQPELVAA